MSNKGISAIGEEEEIKSPKGKYYFLGIGINEYKHFNKLNNARKDIEDVRALLCESFYFEEKNTEIIIDEQASRRNIIRKINELRTKITDQDSVLIYYSGHGKLDGKLGFWIPVDAEKDQIADYISNVEIRGYIKNIPAKHILLISDSCFAASLLVREANRADNGAFDTWEKNKSRHVFISGKGVVSDGESGKNSPFATAIIKHLKEEVEERINIAKLANEVTTSVRFNYEQQADLSPLFDAGHDGGQFIFRKLRQETPDWSIACKKNTLEAYETFLLKYPDSQFLVEAKKKITNLKDDAFWKKTELLNNEIAYLDYARQFKKGKYYEIAIQRMEAFGDEGSWEQAKLKNSIVAYIHYQEAYPKGKYIAEAAAMIAVLEDKHKLEEEKAKKEQAERERIEILKKAEEEARFVQEQEAAKQRRAQAEREWLENLKKEEETRIAQEQVAAALQKEQQEQAEREKAEALRIAAKKEQQMKIEQEHFAIPEAERRLEHEALVDKAPPRQLLKPSFIHKFRIPLALLGLLLVFLIWKYLTPSETTQQRTQITSTPPEDSIKSKQLSTQSNVLGEKGTKSGKGEVKSNTTLEKANDAKKIKFTSFTDFETIGNGVKIKMVAVKGGTFPMGSNGGESDEKPVHSVYVSDFYIGKYEVSQKQWRAMMGTEPSYFKNCDDCPVEQVSWNDAQEFITTLNSKTGKQYRLPTEAEWEYAARGGNKSKGYTYSGSNTVGDVAQYEGNNYKSTKSVGSKNANELGIYDMSGNVREWCNDWYKGYPGSSGVTDYTGSRRVNRGGGWGSDPQNCRVAGRFTGTSGNRSAGLGLRVCLSSENN